MIQPEKILRKVPILSFGVLLLILGMFATQTYKDINRKVPIKAQAHSLQLETQHVEIGTNHFTTNAEGTLYWKPRSFKEAFVLRHIANADSSFNIIDLLYLLIINCILFWMFYDLKLEYLFNKKILIGIRIIGPLIVLYGAMGMIKYIVSNYFLNDITKGQFKPLSPDGFSLTPFLITMLLLQIIMIFVSKVQRIQQEQHYTI